MRHSQKRTVVIFASTLVLTPLWLMLSYIKWHYIDVDISLALSSFQKWPWFKASVAMALTTYLYSFYALYQYLNHSVKIDESAAIYSLAYIWLFFFIFYPGSEAFGGSDNNSWFWMTGINVTHYLSVKYYTQNLVEDKY